jgi:cysteine synthase A
MARWLVENDGIFVGSSSAVNCELFSPTDGNKANILGVAALETAKRLGPGHTIVTILCDSGMRHLSKFWAQIGDVGGEAKTTIDNVLNGTTLS